MNIRKIVVFDGFMAMVIVYQILRNTGIWGLTIFQSLIVAFLAGNVFMLLFQIKYVGNVMEILAALLWTYLCMIFIPFGEWTNNSKPWLVCIAIVLFAIFFKVHYNPRKGFQEEQNENAELLAQYEDICNSLKNK